MDGGLAMTNWTLTDSLPEFVRDTLVALSPGLCQLLAGWMILG